MQDLVCCSTVLCAVLCSCPGLRLARGYTIQYGNIRDIAPLQRCENAACASGIHTLHAPPRSNYSPGTGKVQGACAAICQTRVISRSERKSKRSVGNIRDIAPLQRLRKRHVQMASTLYTRPRRSNITVLAHVKCREHARPCQTRAISRSEKIVEKVGLKYTRDCTASKT